MNAGPGFEYRLRGAFNQSHLPFPSLTPSSPALRQRSARCNLVFRSELSRPGPARPGLPASVKQATVRYLMPEDAWPRRRMPARGRSGKGKNIDGLNGKQGVEGRARRARSAPLEASLQPRYGPRGLARTQPATSLGLGLSGLLSRQRRFRRTAIVDLPRWITWLKSAQTILTFMAEGVD